MASGVFGTPITLETVAATGLYPEPITRRNCADYAEKMINAGGKDDEALKYVDNLKEEYGNGISAKCLIYNATGTTLNFVSSIDFHGHVYDNPYPTTIMNGQWGAFLHVHPHWGVGTGCSGAVVYRSLRPDDDQSCDWSYSWRIPYVGSNGVFTLIREVGHFSGDAYWDEFFSILESSGQNSTDNYYGYSSEMVIAQGTTAVVRGVFKISPP